MSRPRPQAFPVQGNWPPHMRGLHVTPRSPKTLPTGEISCNWPPFKVPKVQLLGPKVPGQEQHKTKGIEHIGALRPGRASPALPPPRFKMPRGHRFSSSCAALCSGESCPLWSSAPDLWEWTRCSPGGPSPHHHPRVPTRVPCTQVQALSGTVP